jgi:hypothetical protein
MSKRMLVISVAALFSVTACTSASDSKLKTQTFYVGGHDPGRNVRVVAEPESTAPYALTGNASQAPRYEPIRVGSRVVGQRLVQE